MQLNAVSMFAGAGVGETYLKEIGVDVLVANELVPKRAKLYQALYSESIMVCGDIRKADTLEQIYKAIGSKEIDLLLASPPCQGMSIAGKNRTQEDMVGDSRNFLIFNVMDMIKSLDPDFVLIENVKALLQIRLEHKSKSLTVVEILSDLFSDKYDIQSAVLNAADYGVPQTRLRAIIKMNRKGMPWFWPPKHEKKVTVQEAIGHLPTLESEEHSDIPWHFARKHDARQIVWLKHTATGTSAFKNPVYYPQKVDGTRVSGYESSYRRIRWDEPAPTITIRNDCVSSQRNVHPGRLLTDGTYSDARVLSPLEIMILSSLPSDWAVPKDTPEILIRQCIGESIPPLMIKAIVKEINNGK